MVFKRFSLTANIILKPLTAKTPEFLLFIVLFTTTMASSSKHVSFADQLASLIMLNVKNGQNMIIDIDSSTYDKFLRPIIECLKFSTLARALTMAKSVPLVHLSKAYSSAI